MRAPYRLVAVLALCAGAAQAFVWPSDVERTVRGLGADDLSVRRRAARDLLSLPASVVRRVARAALGDADADVRVLSLEALLEARQPGIGALVVAWLGDPDPRVRRAAAEALAKDPHPPAVGALGRVLSDPDAAVRVASARALGRAGSTASVVSLLGRLEDTDPDVRAEVVRALARIHDGGAVVPLVGKLQDSRPNVRRVVAEALGTLGDARASGALALALRDQDEIVRVAALGALGRLRAEDAVPTIAALLDEERRPAVRQAALLALAKIPSDTGMTALLHALAEDDPRERSPVRVALAEAGARAVPKLEACLEGQPPFALGDGCALTLGEMRADSAAGVVGAALRRGVVRPIAALRALGAAGDPRGLPVVLEYLGSEDPWVRRAAVEAADSLLDPFSPDGRAVEPLARAFDAAHARRSERAALVALLGKTGSRRAAPVLLSVAKGATDPVLRLAAVRALGLLGPAGQDAALLRALADESAPLRLAAALSLRKTASPKTATVLLDRFERAADQDRAAVGIALGGALALAPRAAIERAAQLLRRASATDRDALVEGIASVHGSLGSSPLVALLAGSPDGPLRAKIAEGLGTHPEAAQALTRLASDPSASVRAAAVWSIGAMRASSHEAVLTRALADREVAVAANAAAALGRLAVPAERLEAALCGVLAEPRAAVRAGALAGLALARARCAGGVELVLLVSDPSELVRSAAARLVLRTATGDVDANALARCAAEDPSGDVAVACVASSGPSAGNAASSGDVSVYVVPAGAVAPVPYAPFALVRSDGLVRYGSADSRGALVEHDAPRGALRLGTPAALVE